MRSCSASPPTPQISSGVGSGVTGFRSFGACILDDCLTGFLFMTLLSKHPANSLDATHENAEPWMTVRRDVSTLRFNAVANLGFEDFQTVNSDVTVGLHSNSCFVSAQLSDHEINGLRDQRWRNNTPDRFVWLP